MTGCLTERSLDHSNRVVGSQKDHVKQIVREETQQKENMPFSSQEYAEKLQKENMTLMKALAHRNKIIELSGVEFQKLRINLRDMQDKNLQLAQANSQMLAELNTNRDSFKTLQHELGCKNALLKVRKHHEEQTLPYATHHGSKDKVPANASDGNCKSFQEHNINHKDTKRKRTPHILASESSDIERVHVNVKANSKRKVSGVIDTANIPEETCQTEDYIEKVVVSQGTNQNFDAVVNKKYVLNVANPLKDSVHSKRQCTRRQSTKFIVHEIEETEKLVEMDDAKETASRPFLRRRSARLRPEEAEACKSLHEGDEVKETIKRKRISLRKQSARFDFQEPEVTETLNADDTGSLVSEESTGSRSEAVEPSKRRQDTKETKCRVSTRRQSTKGKSQIDEAIKEVATYSSLPNNIVQECNLEREAKDEAIKEVAIYKEKTISRVSTRRQSTKGKSQTDEAIKEVATDSSLPNNIVQECETEAKDKAIKEVAIYKEKTISRVSTKRQSTKGKSQTDEAIKEVATDSSLPDNIVQECETEAKDKAIKEVAIYKEKTISRVSTKRQSTKGKSQTDEAIKEVATNSSLPNNIVQECDHETEAKDKPKADENEGMVRRTSVGRPSRHAAEKIQSYREVSLKVKMRRKF